MAGREVVLEGGPPWGFRMTWGSDTAHNPRVSRVNPGSVSALAQVREGDLISSINGQQTSQLSNQEAQAILNSDNTRLVLHLYNKRGEEQKKKKMINKNILTPALTSPILAATDQGRLPLPSSPEYILLRKSREKKRSESLSSLQDSELVDITLIILYITFYHSTR